MATVSTLCIALLALGSSNGSHLSDSLDILRDARQSQRDFERVRRVNLPYDWSPLLKDARRYRRLPVRYAQGRLCLPVRPTAGLKP